jgi:FkbM family methyltransferase
VQRGGPGGRRRRRGLKADADTLRLPRGTTLRHLPGARLEARFIVDEIFLRRIYVQHGIEIRDGDRILDVGANIGTFALFCGFEARGLELYCFEPVEPVREVLAANVRQLAERGHEVHVLDFGLSDREGVAAIEFYPRAPGNSTLFPGRKREELREIARSIRFGDAWRWHRAAALALALARPVRGPLVRLLLRRAMARARTLAARLRPLSAVLDELGLDEVDLLKVDVEGSELDVLRGIRDHHWPAIRQLVVEGSPASTPRLPALRGRLADAGFDEVVVTGVGGRPVAEGSPLPWMLYATRGRDSSSAAISASTSSRAVSMKKWPPAIVCISKRSPVSSAQGSMHHGGTPRSSAPASATMGQPSGVPWRWS